MLPLFLAIILLNFGLIAGFLGISCDFLAKRQGSEGFSKGIEKLFSLRVFENPANPNGFNNIEGFAP